MLTTFRKTPVAARELGIPYSRLIGLIRYEKIAAPSRDSSGDYLWTDEDLARARAALQQIRKPVRAGAAVPTTRDRAK